MAKAKHSNNNNKTKSYKNNSKTTQTTKKTNQTNHPSKTTSTFSKSKLTNQNKLIILGIVVALLIVGYFTLGLAITIILALGIGFILGLARLLDRVKGKKTQRRILNIVLISFLSIAILVCMAGIAFLGYVVVKAPKFDVKRLNTKETSLLLDIDNQIYAELGAEKREKVSYDELPQVLVDAIVATEDSRYFQHNGFDAPRFIKAVAGQLLGRNAGGASTISMQVIKNSFTSSEASGFEGYVRKFTDIYLAVFKLEKNYTKEEIFEFYVNNHLLGGNIYGVEQASQYYFGKSVKDLNLSEAATIAGMFQSPNRYRPNVNPKNATARRTTVLNLMKRHGYITQEEFDIANSIPMQSLTVDSTANVTPYQSYIDTVVTELNEKYNINPYVTPVEVHTNLNRGKQDAVNRILAGDGFDWDDDKIQAGISVLDSQTGKILAVGNGRNQNGDDRIFYGTKLTRQPGSTAKPLFDYGPGMEYNNFSTYTLFDDAPYSYSDGREVNNWDGSFYGTLTLRRSLALSRNIPALKAFQQVDNKKIIEFVEGLGITPEVENGKIHEAHSLGAFTGVSPLQMSAAYAAFSNGGYYNEPYSINKFIYRDDGKVVEHEEKRHKAMSDSTAYMITSVLQDVTIMGSPIHNVAVKTGTTNFDWATIERLGLPGDAIRDSWVVGYSTKTVIGMWYGYNTSNSEYCMRNGPSSVQRERLFRALANNVFESDREEFKMPDSVIQVGIEMGSNPPMLAPAGSENVVYEYFKKGTEPTETAKQYIKLATPGNLKATYNQATKKVTITWNKVTPGDRLDSFGAFGYNVYYNDTLLGFTEKTTFTINNPSNPYGKYKVIATFKDYNANQSDPATTTLGEDEKEITSELSGSTSQTAAVGSLIPTPESVITVLEDNVNVTAKASFTTTVTDESGIILNDTTFTTAGTYRVIYHVVYKTHKKDYTITYTVS